MKILIAEDTPEFKIYGALEELKKKNIEFQYDIFPCATKTLRAVKERLAEYDLAIIDLGLPMFDNEPVKSDIEGFNIVKEIIRRCRKDDLHIPIIINSTTKLKGTNGESEEQLLSCYADQIIEHVDQVSGSWLYNFIQEHAL